MDQSNFDVQAIIGLTAQIGELKGMMERNFGYVATMEARILSEIAATNKRVLMLESEKENKVSDTKHWQIIAGTLIGGLAGSLLQWGLQYLHK